MVCCFLCLHLFLGNKIIPKPQISLYEQCEQIPDNPHRRFVNAQLELLVESLSERQYVGEPLKLSVKVKNTGTENITIPLSLVERGSLFVRVFDQEKNLVAFPGAFTVATYSITRMTYAELEPDDFWGTERLTRTYHIVLSKPGVYYIQANGGLFKGEFLRRVPVWQGSLRSKPLKIIVLPKPVCSRFADF